MIKVDRRKLLVTATSVACASLMPAAERASAATVEELLPVEPEQQLPQISDQYKETLARIVGKKVPIEARVVVDMPEEVENGNIVPYTLSVEPSEEDESGEIVRLHLLSTRNPQARVASFQFTPLTGKPQVTGRMRLARSQDVVAVAETNTGEFLFGHQNVKVDIGGCATE